MMEKYRIRPYRDGDEFQILQLRKEVFGDLDPIRLCPDVWKWQFKDNPAGPFFCSLAEADGTIVGQYATIPTRFSIEGQETILAMACDIMTHPHHRGQGLFTTLAKDLYHQLETEHNIPIVWGFPNDQVLPGYTQRLGWRALHPIPMMIMPLRPLAMILRAFPWPGGLFKKPCVANEIFSDLQRTKTVSGLTMEPIHHFHEGFDELWQAHLPSNPSKTRQSSPIIQIRDSRYLQWRYLAVSKFGYHPFAIRHGEKLIGYLVLRMMAHKNQNFGILVDLFPFPTKPGPLLSDVLAFAGKFVKANGGDFLTCLSPPDRFRLLRQSGFKKFPEIINPKTWHFGYRCGQGRILDDWYMTLGDTDVV